MRWGAGAERKVLLAALVAYLLVGAVLLLGPTPAAPSAGVGRALLWARAAGFESMTGARAEYLCNVALFVLPVPLAVRLWPHVAWRWWLGGGLAASVLVETAQWVFLPARSPQLVDVTANTLGAALGVLAVWLVHRDGQRRPVTPPRPPLAPALAAGGLFLVLVATPVGSALFGRWARLLAWLGERGWPAPLTEVGGWRMLACGALVALAAVAGARVWPRLTALGWAGAGALLAALAGVLDGRLLSHTSVVASLAVAGAVGAFAGAWWLRGMLSPPVPERCSP